MRARHCRTLRSLHLLPPSSKPLPVHEGEQQHERYNCHGYQRQFQVKNQHNQNHPDNSEDGSDQRRQSINGQKLEPERVILDPVRRVTNTLRVMIVYGAALHLSEETGTSRKRNAVANLVGCPDVQQLLTVSQDRANHEYTYG